MKKKKILFVVITAILTVIMSVAFTGCEKKVTFDFKEYAKLNFTGNDHYGKADLRTYKIENIPDRFYADITYHLSKNEDLLNGEKVTLSFKWDKDYAKKHNISVKNSEFDVTVEGLEPTTEINPFENVTLECETEYLNDRTIKDNNLKENYINIPEIKSSDSSINYLFDFKTNQDYELTKGYGAFSINRCSPEYRKYFKNGDTVTVVAVADDTFLRTSGYYVTNFTKTEDGKYIVKKDFVCSGFDKFINDINDIPSDSIQDFKQKAFESVKEYANKLAGNKTYFNEFARENVFSKLYGSDTELKNVTITSCDNVEFNSSYFVTGKNGSSRLYFIYNVSFTGSAKDITSQQVNGVIAVYYTNLMFDSQNNVISKGINDESGFRWNSPEKNFEDIKNNFMKTYGEVQLLEN